MLPVIPLPLPERGAFQTWAFLKFSVALDHHPPRAANALLVNFCARF